MTIPLASHAPTGASAERDEIVRAQRGELALAGAAAAMLVLWLLRPVPPAAPPSSPAVSIDEPILPAAHELDRGAIRRTLDEQLLPHVQLCHEWLAINTTFASGQMVIELAVERRDGRGVVTRAAFDPSPSSKTRPSATASSSARGS